MASDPQDRNVQTIAARPAAVTRDESLSPVVTGDLVRVGQDTDVRYLTEQEEARERLRASVDRLASQANLQLQVQKEPLKMLGGASAVGAVVGLVLGRQFRRSKKIYVDADSPVKHQKAFIKAQKRQGGNNAGGALMATLATMAVKTLADKVLVPKLEEMANGLLDQAKPGQPGKSPVARRSAVAAASTASTIPAAERPRSSTATSDLQAGAVSHAPAASAAPAAPGLAPVPAHVGVIPMPESKVEAKAQGTPISEQESLNPNSR